MKIGSESAYKNVLNYSHKLPNAQSNEECLEIFYKNSDSFSIKDNNELNFNGRKVFVYLHGGYWQWGSVRASSFMAKNFTDKDIILVALGYDLAPNGFI